MASDVDDLTSSSNSTFHTDSSSHSLTSTLIDEKSYQPIFDSFAFADSDPVSHAGFINIPSTIDREEQRPMEDYSSNNDHLSNSSQSNIDDIDEDDFDGIPIRHASITNEKKLNGETIEYKSHPQLNELIQRIEQSLHDEHEMEDETFLNDFIDEQHESTTMGSTLFKDIPDIDDPNPPEDDEEEGIPFDHMDMSDQSDSVRSSSPDSLLSSSHLRDEHEDVDVEENDDDDNEVEQWNDEHLLETASSKALPLINGEHPVVNLPNNPFDQVDFIDSSRSHSRCSNASSHLSGGYADQARQFLSDDELMSSSDSDNNDDVDYDDQTNMNNHVNDIPGETINDDDDDDDICLQVDLDDHRSISSSSESNSIRSTPSIPDETPIVDIDHIEVETKDQQIAPIAALDDEDDNDEPFQPVLPNSHVDLKTLIDLKTTQHRNELIHDIIHMRHFFNDNNHNDEFLAIMHNPQIFEDVLFHEYPKVRMSTSLMKRND